MIIMITIISLLVGYKNYYNKTEKVYLLSLCHTSSKSKVESVQAQVDKEVGVSFVYEKGGVNYIVGFVYYNNKDAMQTLSKVKEKFPTANILTISNSKLKAKNYRQIKNSSVNFTAYKSILSIRNAVYKLCKDVDMGANVFKIYTSLEKMIVSLEQMYGDLSRVENNKVSDSLKSSCSMKLSLIRACQEAIVMDESLIDSVKLLYLKLCFEDIELKKTLNSI